MSTPIGISSSSPPPGPSNAQPNANTTAANPSASASSTATAAPAPGSSVPRVPSSRASISSLSNMLPGAPSGYIATRRSSAPQIVLKKQVERLSQSMAAAALEFKSSPIIPSPGDPLSPLWTAKPKAAIGSSSGSGTGSAKAATPSEDNDLESGVDMFSVSRKLGIPVSQSASKPVSFSPIGSITPTSRPMTGAGFPPSSAMGPRGSLYRRRHSVSGVTVSAVNVSADLPRHHPIHAHSHSLSQSMGAHTGSSASPGPALILPHRSWTGNIIIDTSGASSAVSSVGFPSSNSSASQTPRSQKILDENDVIIQQPFSTAHRHTPSYSASSVSSNDSTPARSHSPISSSSLFGSSHNPLDGLGNELSRHFSLNSNSSDHDSGFSSPNTNRTRPPAAIGSQSQSHSQSQAAFNLGSPTGKHATKVISPPAPLSVSSSVADHSPAKQAISPRAASHLPHSQGLSMQTHLAPTLWGSLSGSRAASHSNTPSSVTPGSATPSSTTRRSRSPSPVGSTRRSNADIIISPPKHLPTHSRNPSHSLEQAQVPNSAPNPPSKVQSGASQPLSAASAGPSISVSIPSGSVTPILTSTAPQTPSHGLPLLQSQVTPQHQRKNSLTTIHSILSPVFTMTNVLVSQLDSSSRRDLTHCPLCGSPDFDDGELVTVLTVSENKQSTTVHAKCLTYSNPQLLKNLAQKFASSKRSNEAATASPPISSVPASRPGSRVNCRFQFTILHPMEDVRLAYLESPATVHSAVDSMIDTRTGIESMTIYQPPLDPIALRMAFAPNSGRVSFSCRCPVTAEEWNILGSFDLSTQTNGTEFDLAFNSYADRCCLVVSVAQQSTGGYTVTGIQFFLNHCVGPVAANQDGPIKAITTPRSAVGHTEFNFNIPSAAAQQPQSQAGAPAPVAAPVANAAAAAVAAAAAAAANASSAPGSGGSNVSGSAANPSLAYIVLPNGQIQAVPVPQMSFPFNAQNPLQQALFVQSLQLQQQFQMAFSQQAAAALANAAMQSNPSLPMPVTVPVPLAVPGMVSPPTSPPGPSTSVSPASTTSSLRPASGDDTSFEEANMQLNVLNTIAQIDNGADSARNGRNKSAVSNSSSSQTAPHPKSSGHSHSHPEGLIALAKTQAGSRLLQTKLSAAIDSSSEADRAYVNSVFDELFPAFDDLMTDLFGNYLCQKILAVANAQQRLAVMQKIAPNFVSIGCDRQGTRACQKLMECMKSNEEFNFVIECLSVNSDSLGPKARGVPLNLTEAERTALSTNPRAPILPRLLHMIRDPNGSHVIHSILDSFPLALLSSLLQCAFRSVRSLGMDQHGLCVLKKCVSICSSEDFISFALRVSHHLLEYVNNQYGNYLVQHILERANGFGSAAQKENEEILNSYRTINEAFYKGLKGHFSRLARQKFSSNVVEKSLKMRDKLLRQWIVSELLEGDSVAALLQCSFGNFVLQNCLFACDRHSPELRELLHRVGSETVLNSLRKNVRNKWEKILMQIKTGTLDPASISLDSTGFGMDEKSDDHHANGMGQGGAGGAMQMDHGHKRGNNPGRGGKQGQGGNNRAGQGNDGRGRGGAPQRSNAASHGGHQPGPMALGLQSHSLSHPGHGHPHSLPHSPPQMSMPHPSHGHPHAAMQMPLHAMPGQGQPMMAGLGMSYPPAGAHQGQAPVNFAMNMNMPMFHGSGHPHPQMGNYAMPHPHMMSPNSQHFAAMHVNHGAPHY